MINLPTLQHSASSTAAPYAANFVWLNQQRLETQYRESRQTSQFVYLGRLWYQLNCIVMRIKILPW